MQTGRRSAVTIGAYDGVHIGHRQVIDTVRRLAKEQDLDSVVVTFDRHPASVVRPESAPKLLCDLEQKLELLAATGVDRVVVIGFDEDRANERAEEFVEEVLGEQLAASVVVVGRDFHFGKGRGGNVALLETMGAELGFVVVPFSLVPDPAGGGIVSSTGIRRLIAAGELGEAARLLGRPHEVRGPMLAIPAGSAEVSGMGATRAFCVDVPPEILRPPAGTYGVLVGLASSEGREALPPVPGRAVVPADEHAPLQVAQFGTQENGMPPEEAPGRRTAVATSDQDVTEAGESESAEELEGRIGRVIFSEGIA